MNGLDFGTAIGLIKGLGSPDPAVIESAVSDWLDDHPEATTTVQDGSITKAKLDNSLQGTVDDVANLKSHFTDISQTTRNMFDDSVLRAAGFAVDADGYYYGKTRAWVSAFSSELPVDGIFESGKIYTGSLEYYFSGVGSYASSALTFKAKYTDDTTANLVTLSAYNQTLKATQWTSNASKSLDHVYFALADARANDYILHIRFMQIEEGASKTDYVPHFTARDIKAETGIAANADSIDNIRNVIGSRIINPTCELVKLPDVVTWANAFQSFFENGDEIWFCTPSTTFAGATCDGHIYRMSKTDNSFLGKIIHNMGHMAQVDYDADADRIMLCNTESASEPKIYVFHGVSNWLEVATAASNKLDVNDLVYDVIDLADLRSAHLPLTYMIACWAEPQLGGNRLVIGEGNNGHQWFKLMLGMGSNDLGEGTFVSADADRFNGSYKTIWYKTCDFDTIPNGDTPQGNQGLKCYKGAFWEPVGHYPCYGGKYQALLNDKVVRDVFEIQFFKPDGSIAGNTIGDCEGINIIDGKLCIGISGASDKTYLVKINV